MECVLWLVDRKRRLGPGLLIVLHAMQAPTEVDSCSIKTPFWDNLKATNLLYGQNFGQYMWSYILFGRRNDQMCDCSLIHGL